MPIQLFYIERPSDISPKNLYVAPNIIYVGERKVVIEVLDIVGGEMEKGTGLRKMDVACARSKPHHHCPTENASKEIQVAVPSKFTNLRGIARHSELVKIMASKEKNASLIEQAKAFKNVPWCDDYEKMISGMLFAPQFPY